MAVSKVNYNYLGKSGVQVSNLCLGALTFGESSNGFPTQASEQLSFEIMDKYAELGGNFIDTSNTYGFGNSERIVGNWLTRQDRRSILIATKVGRPMGTDFNRRGLSRRNMTESLDESLERLQTPFVDLLQTHLWDNATPIEETLRTLDDLSRCGKIRYFGVCNVCGWQLQKIVDKIEMMGLNRCVSLQQQYNLLCRQPEWEELMVCENEGIGVLPWSPLKGGILTGKFGRGVKPDANGSRIGYIHTDESKATQAKPAWSDFKDDDNYWKLIDSMRIIGGKYGKSIPQVALRWLLQKPVVSSVIIGATSVKQLEENMGASSGWSLADEEMASLDELAPRPLNYPYEFIWRNPKDRVNKFNRPCL
ncbi:hypothetical protein ACF0H5_003529 [Mactra antiquata]